MTFVCASAYLTTQSRVRSMNVLPRAHVNHVFIPINEMAGAQRFDLLFCAADGVRANNAR